MKKVLLVMCRKVLAEALQAEIRSDPQFSTMIEYRYENAEMSADVFSPDVVLLELPESGAPEPEKCTALSERLRAGHPLRRVLLLCPEGNALACRETMWAVREKRADDFVYYDTSMRYLLAKLAIM